MIQAKALAYSYPGARKILFPDLEAGKGEHYLLLGNSGSGKTTLLHLMGGLLRVQEGSVNVDGQSIGTMSEQALDAFRGKHFGFIFQRNHLLPSLTVEENLLMAPYLAGAEQNQQRVEEVLKQLQLSDKRRSRIQELSQGQAQRVAIARAMMNKPAIILADEPTSALDDANCDRVIELLLEVAAENQSTMLIATHDQRLKSKITHQIKL